MIEAGGANVPSKNAPEACRRFNSTTLLGARAACGPAVWLRRATAEAMDAGSARVGKTVGLVLMKN